MPSATAKETLLPCPLIVCSVLPPERLFRTFVLLTFCIISNIYSNVNESGRLFRTYFRYSVSYVLCRRGTHVPNIRLLFRRQARILRISCGVNAAGMQCRAWVEKQLRTCRTVPWTAGDTEVFLWQTDESRQSSSRFLII